MKLEELYSKLDSVLSGGLNISVQDHFIFDLTDENSQKSLKQGFPGIESLMMPEAGRYLIVATFVENPECLMLLFPEQTNGNLSLRVFNTKSGKAKELTTRPEGGGKLTIDNFNDFANMGDITTKFNEFVFSADGGEDAATEVKDIGSYDVSNDEPVELNNNTENEETEMKFKRIDEDITDTNEPKWVEIPNSNAGRVTVTEDDVEDPFDGDDMGGDPSASPDAGGGDTADMSGPSETGDDGAAPADTSSEAPADTTGGTIDDPKAKMRELLAYYTNYMTELVQDPNTSTELIAATQEMIDSLISNMESADNIEEVKGEGEEEAKADATTDTGDVAATTEPVEAPTDTSTEEPVQEDTDEQAILDKKIDDEVDALHADDWEPIAPMAGGDIVPPGDLSQSMVNDVDISGVMPTPDEDLMATTPDMDAPAPTSDALDDTAPLTPDEEVSLLGDDDTAMFGADGLPVDTFDGDVDSLIPTTVSRKIQWSPDYATNGVATTDDNANVVPSALRELSEYYGKVADEVSKCPGKEDIAMKLQKIQILSQTIQNEWQTIVNGLGGVCANSFDRGNMGEMEKDSIDFQAPMTAVGNDVMAAAEKEEEDDLAIANQIAAYCESVTDLF